jgi:hypothetical protein
MSKTVTLSETEWAAIMEMVDIGTSDSEYGSNEGCAVGDERSDADRVVMAAVRKLKAKLAHRSNPRITTSASGTGSSKLTKALNILLKQ